MQQIFNLLSDIFIGRLVLRHSLFLVVLIIYIFFMKDIRFNKGIYANTFIKLKNLLEDVKMRKYLEEKSTLLVILSAIISGIAFTVDNLGILMWISFIPLLYVLIRKENTFIKIFKAGTIFGTTYYLVILHWIFNLYPFEWLDLGKTKSMIILFCGWILISLVEGLVIGIILGIFKYLKIKNDLLNIFTIASLWFVIEYIQEQGVLGFPWGKLAISQVYYLPIIQSVSLFGSSFISFIIIVFNGMILEGIINYKKNKVIAMKSIFIAILIFIVNIAYGYIRLNDKSYSEKVNVTAVQGNINTTEKWQKGDISKNLNIYKELTIKAVENSSKYEEKVNVVLWPETAIPIDISNNSWILEEYKSLAKSFDITFMTGTFYTDYKSDSYKYNSIVAINDKGDIEDIYFKRHLVPFGEALPFEKFLLEKIPIIKELNLVDGDLKAGKESIIIDDGNLKIGCLVCYESIFPQLVIESVNNGAEVIFIASNDSWFKDSKAVYEHNNNAILRAIESNRYVVRAANTGISCFIDNRGRIVERLNPLKRGYINSSVEIRKDKSLYTMIGEYIIYIIILFIACIYLIAQFIY